jgi:hypothetical protein
MKYCVTLGYEVEVEADTREEAMDAAVMTFSEDTHPNVYIAFIDELENE